MRGDAPSVDGQRRYMKFGWYNLDGLTPIGKVDYQPKGGAFRIFQEGRFLGSYLETFPAHKNRRKLTPFGKCVYCGDQNTSKLTSEHIIPEFLGAGLELPQASCDNCQKVTSSFEQTIARDMFAPIRKAFSLQGKTGVIKASNFTLDVGRETSQHEFIPLIHYPTVLVLPNLYPASSYSRRPLNADDPFNFLMYNINADASALKKYSLDSFSSQSIDMVRFAQMIAKIAHVYAMHYHRSDNFIPTVADFIRTDYPPATSAVGYFAHVGGLLQTPDKPSKNLHEIEVGEMEWNGQSYIAARVRLFASCDMPSYYVTVGNDNLCS